MRVSESCYAVTGLGYSPPWFVNAGFVVGREITLVVDTGANAAAAASIYGYAVAVRPGNRLRVINTEQHFDHIGGNSFFKSKVVEIWGHVSLRRTEEEFRQSIQEFNDEIANPVRRARRETEVFHHGTTLAMPDRTVAADTPFDLGGLRAEIILTPGHTPSNLSVWVPDDRVLFSGDCLINRYMPNLDSGQPDDWRIWLQSLDRIEALRPQFVVPGHGAVAEGEEVARILEDVREALFQGLKRAPLY